jgi:hypothetical protein
VHSTPDGEKQNRGKTNFAAPQCSARVEDNEPEQNPAVYLIDMAKRARALGLGEGAFIAGRNLIERGTINYLREEEANSNAM